MKNNIGVYIHIPFCVKKCDYCDFYSVANQQNLQDDYVNALINEIKNDRDKFIDRNISTIYLGGGTPSLLSVSNIERILDELFKFRTSENIEITLECNPETIDLYYLENLKKTKVNRLSIGMQSMNNDRLKSIGRIHTKEKFIESYKCARSVGFNNISVDIMFGFYNQEFSEFEQTLIEIISLDPEHISCYSLILEEGTKMHDDYEDVNVSDDYEDKVVDMYEFMVDFLKNKGYSRYEISNFSKNGFESKHNSSYWQNIEYLGFGVAASSLYKNKRYKNKSDLSLYISENGIIEKTDIEKLSKKDIMSEFFFLGLRMDKGVSISEFHNRFNVDMISIYGEQLEKLKRNKLISIENDIIKLTNNGVNLSNYVFECFL